MHMYERVFVFDGINIGMCARAFCAYSILSHSTWLSLRSVAYRNKRHHMMIAAPGIFFAFRHRFHELTERYYYLHKISESLCCCCCRCCSKSRIEYEKLIDVIRFDKDVRAGACLLFSWECTSEQTNNARGRLHCMRSIAQKPSPAAVVAVIPPVAITALTSTAAAAATGAPTSLRANRPFVYTYNEILSIPLLMLAFNISIWLIFSQINWKREEWATGGEEEWEKGEFTGTK